MAAEVTIAKEGGVNPINAKGQARLQKVPSGKKLEYEDDTVVVYNAKGQEVEREIYDYSAYKGEDMTWNERDGNYDLRYGYKMVVRK